MIEIEYPVYIDIYECSSCHNFHDNLEAAEIDPPEEINGEVYTHWAVCPMTGETIFIWSNDE